MLKIFFILRGRLYLGYKSNHIREFQKIAQKIDSLVDVIAETEDKGIRETLKEKLGEATSRKGVLDTEVKFLRQELKPEKEGVIDADSAFALLRAFRKGFRKESASTQASILKDVGKD